MEINNRNQEEETSRDLIMEFVKDPINLRIFFLMNDVYPMDFSSLEMSKILKNKGITLSLKHVRKSVNTLHKFNVLTISRKIQGTKIYCFNKDSELSKELIILCKVFDDVKSFILNLPPKPIIVEEKYYKGKTWVPKNW